MWIAFEGWDNTSKNFELANNFCIRAADRMHEILLFGWRETTLKTCVGLVLFSFFSITSEGSLRKIITNYISWFGLLDVFPAIVNLQFLVYIKNLNSLMLFSLPSRHTSYQKSKSDW